jgi:hypothetical protein
MGADVGLASWRDAYARCGMAAAGTLHQRGRAERGLSIIEAVISVAIMGIAVIVIAASMGACVRQSAFTTGRSAAEAEARRLAEWLRTSASSGPALAQCGGTTTAMDHYGSLLDDHTRAGFDVTVDGVDYFATNVWEAFDPTSPCVGGATPEVQRVRFSVATREGPAAVIAIVVRAD